MKKILIILIFFLLISVLLVNPYKAYAKEDKNVSIEDLIDNLDTSNADKIIEDLSTSQKDIFGYDTFKDKLFDIIKGNDGTFDSFFSYVFKGLGEQIEETLPLLFSILGICVAFSIINAFNSSASTSVGQVVKFAFVLLISISIFSQVMSVIISTKSYVSLLKKQIDVIFPLLMTSMAAIGTTRSIAVYQPAVAILSSGLTQLITVFVIPCFILSIVFEITGHLSDKVKLKNMASFFTSSMKWILGTAFFVFLSFLSVKGITASIYDNMYIRTTKFALSKYVPIIGGYLSEGYNLVFAGGVVIKNGVGVSAIVLLAITLLPLCIKILILSLCLDLLSALSEPIGAGEISSIFKGLSKSIKNLLAIIFGISFLYFIFLVLITCTGNVSI